MLLPALNALAWLSLFITGMMMLFSLAFRFERWTANDPDHPLPIFGPSLIVHLACWAWLLVAGAITMV